MLAGRSESKLAALRDAIGERSSYFVLDATKSNEVEDFTKQINAEYPCISGVTNTIGSVLLRSAHSTSDKDFEETMKVNTLTSFHILKNAVKTMMRPSNGGGSIVFCSSAVALQGISNHEAIAAAKGAIVSMARSAASTYASKNIRINCVAPGLIATPMTERITKSESALKASQSMHALGRIGQPKDVAAALQFFLDPENDFITGQVLGVDGGLSRVKP